jgi:hypothetical protein
LIDFVLLVLISVLCSLWEIMEMGFGGLMSSGTSGLIY